MRQYYPLLFLFVGLQVAIGQKPQPVHHLEIRHELDEKVEALEIYNGRVDVQTGHPISLYAINFQLEKATPELMARKYLKEHARLIGLQYPDLRDLQLHAIRSTDAGDVVRFRQYYNGLPVNKSEVMVSIDPNSRVQILQSSYRSQLKVENTNHTISEEQAIEIATNYINPSYLMMDILNRPMIYQNNQMTRVAHEVMILAGEPQGQWHVYVDAQSGEIFKVQNMLHYNCKHGKDKGCAKLCGTQSILSGDPKIKNPSSRSMIAVVDGDGFVFDPDPLSSAMETYGGNYSDNNDATNVDLDNERVSVVLREIEETAGVYKLLGPWAEISDHDAPNKGLFTQNSSTFNFDREEDGFEAVTCYFHIDSMMRYINVTLGCEAVPYQYDHGVLFDPSGANGADNSFYSSGAGTLTFGEGCVDDGEDSDVIHHELGHFLHDMVTNGGLSQQEGLSEGCGDYVAQSYNRSLGNWTPSDPAYHWVFNWDGHNECWNGRVTNNPDGYPAGLGGGLHSDGTIWSSCMMDVWDILGRDLTDKIFYEGLGMTGGSSNQNDAAVAVYQAAVNLNYSNADQISVHNALSGCGYTLPPIDQPPIVMIESNVTSICLDDVSTIDFMDISESNPAATSRLWTFEGGTPATSTDENVTVSYTTSGTYDVSLSVTNANGTSDLTLTDYITVLSGASCSNCELVVDDTVVPISNSGAGNEYTSIINIPSGGTITDINVANITGEHTYLGDLIFTLIGPSSTEVQLNEAVCGTDEDFNVGFDDQASSGTLPCPYTDGMLYIPFEALSAFNGEDAAGDWTLHILDQFNEDGGQLTSWSIEICIEGELCETDLTVFDPIMGTYNASNSIISGGTVINGSSAIFQAGAMIDLQNGFEVESNAEFLGEISDCPN